MRSLGKLFSAFGTLADSVLSLASVIDVATGRLRQQLALEDAAPFLTHGEVIDGAGVSGGDTPASEGSPSTSKGRRKAS